MPLHCLNSIIGKVFPSLMVRGKKLLWRYWLKFGGVYIYLDDTAVLARFVFVHNLEYLWLFFYVELCDILDMDPMHCCIFNVRSNNNLICSFLNFILEFADVSP